MNENTSAPGLVTVGFDDSEGGRQALEWAADEAERRGAELSIVHAVTPLGINETGWLSEAGIPPSQIRDEALDHARTLLKKAEEGVREAHPGLVVRSSVTTGDARGILLAEAFHSALVVVGSRGHGPLRSLLLGSVGVALVRHSTAPVAVIRPHHVGGDQRVVVGVEATRHSLPLLRAALDEAQWRGVPLTVVSCRWAAEEGYHWLDWVPEGVEGDERAYAVEHMLDQVRGDYPDVKIQVRHTRGRADKCLIDLARDADLMVVGRRTSTVVDQLGLGSMACVIVEHARGSVLTVPTEASEAAGAKA